MQSRIEEIKEFIMDNIDKDDNVIPFDCEGYYEVDDIDTLTDVVNEKFNTDISCNYIGGFGSPGYDVDCYALVGIVDGELFFFGIEEKRY